MVKDNYLRTVFQHIPTIIFSEKAVGNEEFGDRDPSEIGDSQVNKKKKLSLQASKNNKQEYE